MKKGILNATLAVALVQSWAPRSEAAQTQCAAATEVSPCSPPANGGDERCCSPGWVFANNWATSGGLDVTWSPTSLQFTTAYQLNNGYGSCCTALYAGIGSIGTDWVTDQYGTGGSNLPLQLKDVAALKGAWTVKVPQVQSTDIYRVYIEIFLSSSTAGIRDSGNITIDFYYPQYNYPNDNPVSLLGTTLTMADYGTNPNGQGPFLAFRFPQGAYTPDGSGVIHIASVDVGQVLAWSQTYKNYYPGTIYLTEVNLAEEVSNLDGTFTTTFASFEVKKTGESTVYLPAWTSDYWTSGADGGTASGGDSGAAGGDGGAASGGDGGAASDGSGHGPGSGDASTQSGSSSGASGPGGASSSGSASPGSSNGGSSGCTVSGRDDLLPFAWLTLTFALVWARRGRRLPR
jgi:hypothetical protein